MYVGILKNYVIYQNMSNVLKKYTTTLKTKILGKLDGLTNQHQSHKEHHQTRITENLND